jgi:fatty-acyl-CoA synthase
MYHCFGCVIGSLVAAVYGVALILPAPQFDALASLTAVEKERCTLLYGVPTMFIAELEHPEFHKFDLRSLRGGVMAGAPCPVDVMKRVVSEMNCHGLVIGYGLTETSPIITMSEPEDPVELRVATVGRVLPNTEAKIVARETGEIVDVGRPGEICTRGYHVMKGYDKEPDATAATIDPEGWLRTGDLASMDEQGCFHIVGRSKEMICRGGENIYPREVEEFLHGHPKIADVYVVGVPDARLGETVLAAIRLRAGAVCTEADVRDFCRGRIAHFKIPQYIRFVDSFPLTVTGKVQKFKIREAEIESLGLRPLADVQIA